MPKSRRSHKRIPQVRQAPVAPSPSIPAQRAAVPPGKPAATTVKSGAAGPASPSPNPYISTELKAIGMVAGILILVLVVLFVVLR